jgi:hypothetical protein
VRRKEQGRIVNDKLFCTLIQLDAGWDIRLSPSLI